MNFESKREFVGLFLCYILVNSTVKINIISSSYRIAGNFRGRKFSRISRITGYSQNFIRECLVSVDKEGLMALIRENIIRERLDLVHSRKFSPAKISRYTVGLALFHENQHFSNLSKEYPCNSSRNPSNKAL